MDEEKPHPLTGVGKLLLIVTLLLFGFGMYVLFTDVFVNLPAGNYPIFVLLGPLFLACLALFYGGGALLKKGGYPIFTSDTLTKDQASENED